MPKKHKQRDTGCPIVFALDTFGDRWSLIIIRDMAIKGYQTYSQFFESDEGIATNVLADRLLKLEGLGIVDKSRDPEDGRRHLYTLTPKGIDLIPVLLEMIRWSVNHDTNTLVKPQMVKRIKRDRDGFAAELSERVRERQKR